MLRRTNKSMPLKLPLTSCVQQQLHEKNPKKSTINAHILLKGHDAYYEDFSILLNESNVFELHLKESILIKKDLNHGLTEMSFLTTDGILVRFVNTSSEKQNIVLIIIKNSIHFILWFTLSKFWYPLIRYIILLWWCYSQAIWYARDKLRSKFTGQFELWTSFIK